ncbi:Rap guanine nucleotide exchange factor 4 [Trichinella spiralis]|uniref:Rap guanine nucleotide exchange factor 4 n=3 Tax=Trichinella spiralis TaxID=6334 RepID=UPI0001EFC0A3|nr:Rap guanine nucleotide exchange factor 4 [Trichinella spiralis]
MSSPSCEDEAPTTPDIAGESASREQPNVQSLANSPTKQPLSHASDYPHLKQALSQEPYPASGSQPPSCWRDGWIRPPQTVMVTDFLTGGQWQGGAGVNFYPKCPPPFDFPWQQQTFPAGLQHYQRGTGAQFEPVNFHTPLPPVESYYACPQTKLRMGVANSAESPFRLADQRGAIDWSALMPAAYSINNNDNNNNQRDTVIQRAGVEADCRALSVYKCLSGTTCRGPAMLMPTNKRDGLLVQSRKQTDPAPACCLPLEDKIRFGQRDYFGMPVSLNMIGMVNNTGQAVYNVTSAKTKNIAKRKNKNPLATKFTVKSLKQLLQSQNAAFDRWKSPDKATPSVGLLAQVPRRAAAEQQATSGVDLDNKITTTATTTDAAAAAAGATNITTMTTSPITTTTTITNSSSTTTTTTATAKSLILPVQANSINSSRSSTLPFNATPFAVASGNVNFVNKHTICTGNPGLMKNEDKLTLQTNTGTSPRARFYDFKCLQIGNFVVEGRTTSTFPYRLRLYFAKRQLVYDFEWDSEDEEEEERNRDGNEAVEEDGGVEKGKEKKKARMGEKSPAQQSSTIDNNKPLKVGRRMVAIVVRFDSLTAMLFRKREILLAINEPPRLIVNKVQARRNLHVVLNKFVEYSTVDDITNGELRNALVHRILLCKAQGNLIEDHLCQFDHSMASLMCCLDLNLGVVFRNSRLKCPLLASFYPTFHSIDCEDQLTCRRSEQQQQQQQQINVALHCDCPSTVGNSNDHDGHRLHLHTSMPPNACQLPRDKDGTAEHQSAANQQHHSSNATESGNFNADWPFSSFVC